MEQIIPDWFPAWFDGLFDEAAYHPTGIARRLGIDNQTVTDACMRGDLRAVRIAATASRVPTFKIQRAEVREWLVASLEINRAA